MTQLILTSPGAANAAPATVTGKDGKEYERLSRLPETRQGEGV
jgi:hypothetical protein